MKRDKRPCIHHIRLCKIQNIRIHKMRNKFLNILQNSCNCIPLELPLRPLL